jgi:hypothetical protein
MRKKPVVNAVQPDAKKRQDTQKKTIELIRKELTERVGSKAMSKVVII